MKLAYIILTHKNTGQVYRLFERLNDSDTNFIIHVSKSCEKGFDKEIKSLFKNEKNVFFCKREDGTHFSWGVVKAIINALKLLIKFKIDFDYVNLITGQDYPIKTNKYIEEFFEKNNGKQFITYFPMIETTGEKVHDNKIWWEGKQLFRIDRYHIRFAGKMQSIPELLTERLISHSFIKTLKIFLYETPEYIKKHKFKEEFGLFILSRLLPLKRKLPDTFVPYGGKTWWSITNECAKFILDKHNSDTRFSKFFKYTLIPDEMYFQTILMNCNNSFEIVNDYYREQEWEGGDKTHPIIFNNLNHFERLKNSKNLFARKFDSNSEILNLIDKDILKYT